MLLVLKKIISKLIIIYVCWQHAQKLCVFHNLLLGERMLFVVVRFAVGSRLGNYQHLSYCPRLGSLMTCGSKSSLIALAKDAAYNSNLWVICKHVINVSRVAAINYLCTYYYLFLEFQAWSYLKAPLIFDLSAKIQIHFSHQQAIFNARKRLAMTNTRVSIFQCY